MIRLFAVDRDVSDRCFWTRLSHLAHSLEFCCNKVLPLLLFMQFYRCFEWLL